jgi:CRP/FNR family transcriptional regulator, cyclic AMP receptor protein
MAAQASSHLTSVLASPVAIIAYLFAALGISLVVVSAFVRTMIPLRWLAVGSNVGFLVYGALYPSIIPLLIAATLLPINLYRTREMIRLTQRVRRSAASSDLSGVWLKPYMKAKRFKAGTTLFHKGDLADHLYLLADGRMELADIGQMLLPGKLFGEIAFFSPSRRRTHTARCIDDCTVLMIDESTVQQLYFQNPSFGLHLIGLVAGRLSADVERLERQLAETAKP